MRNEKGLIVYKTNRKNTIDIQSTANFKRYMNIIEQCSGNYMDCDYVFELAIVVAILQIKV